MTKGKPLFGQLDPDSIELRQWAAFQFAVGAVAVYQYDARYPGTVTVSVAPFGPVLEVRLRIQDFAGVLRAPIGQWFPKPVRQQ